jgi:HK97 family phage major capsid protein
MGHDTILRYMKEMSDSQGRPIWLPGLVSGEPDLFDGDMFTTNQDMATSASSRALIYGHMPKFWIRDTMEIELLRLNERYAEKGQVSFLAFMRTDSDIIDGTAIKYLTLLA